MRLLWKPSFLKIVSFFVTATALSAPSTADKPLMRALRGEAAARPPIWLMRQAGRYLPEYRALREKAGGFLDLCYTPDFAVEVTLQPIRRFGFDAAILFSDILVVPHALGRDLWFVTGEGPRLNPLETAAEIPAFDAEAFHARLAPVYETVGRLREELPAETTLIGFAGAPWTVATYMVAGRGGLDQAPARRFAYRDPEGFGRLIDLLTEASIAYLSRQIEAGAETVQIFDSWAGALAPAEYDRWCMAPIRAITRALKARWPEVPVIGFPKGSGARYADFARFSEVDAVGLDTAVQGEWAAKAIPAGVATQGNLDPVLMTIGGDPLRRGAEQILAAFEGRPHIFNLGHGITPDADPAHVEALMRVVRG